MVGRTKHCELCKSYSPHAHPERLARLYADRAIFVCEDGDIAFADPAFVKKVFQVLSSDTKPNRLWFVQSKDPRCLKQYLSLLPSNTFVATTLETNRDEGYEAISKAPKPTQRYLDFLGLNWDKKIVTVEPILDFDLGIFLQWIKNIHPEVVFIGYNSHPEKVPLPEPEKKKTWQLIHSLERCGIRVLKKEMRDKRVRKKAYRDFK
jgi:hypothetical protein